MNAAHERGPASRRGDLVAAVVIMAAAAILILPVPAALMDLLLSFNVAFAVTLLLLAVRSGGALRAASFPTLLLVSTLVRLALNVSTTRLILGRGDAGAVVRSFGAFVTAGNPLVGGVLFAILTVVQFIVIAKGAERVAEVTARFTLDAMPGRQMSIDADLRAGIIDQEEALAQRRRLASEARFHGAMDGAMKFVKGDAVASMVITAVNLLGGLLVGCLQQGLPITDAVTRYTLLTIGDGLVSQIPALLISVSAGLVVTHSPAADDQAGLGRQVAGQLARHPEALMGCGLVLMLLGLAPGMPLLAFAALGLPAGGGGFWLLRRRAHRRCAPPARSPARLSLRLSVDGAACPPGLPQAVDEGLIALGDELGVPLPALELDHGETAGRWTLWVDAVPVGSGRLEAGPQPLPDDLAAALGRSVVHFVGVQETQDLLDALEASQPALVREVVPRLIPPVMLSEILARLVEERVPVSDLRGILACLAEWARSEADPLALSERVRQRLSTLITRQLAPAGSLQALLLDPEVERCLLDAVHEDGAGGVTLDLSPAQAQAIQTGLAHTLAQQGPGRPVVLCRPELRRSFYKVAAATQPLLRVVSFLELEAHVVVRPVGRIAMVEGGVAA